MSTAIDSAAPHVADGPDDEATRALAPEETILRMRQQVRDGVHWFEAVLDAVGRWRMPGERIGERLYCYLTGGDAFDWLLLAERLLDEMPDLVSPKDANALLFDGRWPLPIDDAEFARRIGAAKYSAHLNYQYGVVVEEALQLSIEEEIHKENRSRPWGPNREDEDMFERVYGKPFREIADLYYASTGAALKARLGYAEWKEFTYWLFKQRLQRQDKARVASDTRKGLAQLTRMEMAVSDRRRGAVLGEADFASRYSSSA
jgi:hypothetical protein